MKERCVFQRSDGLALYHYGGWKIFPKSGKEVGEGHPDGGDWRKGRWFARQQVGADLLASGRKMSKFMVFFR